MRNAPIFYAIFLLDLDATVFFFEKKDGFSENKSILLLNGNNTHKCNYLRIYLIKDNLAYINLISGYFAKKRYKYVRLLIDKLAF